MLEILLIIWGGVTIALFLRFHKANFTWKYRRGEKKPVNAPVLKLLMTAFFSAFLLTTIIPHFIFRFLGLRGFWDASDSSYSIQNPLKRKEYR